MIIQVLLFFNLLVYAVIVSQSFMYMIALRNVQESMEAASYIELRKLIDRNFVKKFKPVMYTALVLSPLLAVLSLLLSTPLVIAGSILAFVGLLADTVLSFTRNIPVNKMIGSWTAEHPPANWKMYRSKWLYYFSWRQVANITGFVSLLAAAVFGFM